MEMQVYTPCSLNMFLVLEKFQFIINYLLASQMIGLKG